MHPLIRASLIKQDQISFKYYSEQAGTLLTATPARPGSSSITRATGWW